MCWISISCTRSLPDSAELRSREAISAMIWRTSFTNAQVAGEGVGLGGGTVGQLVCKQAWSGPVQIQEVAIGRINPLADKGDMVMAGKKCPVDSLEVSARQPGGQRAGAGIQTGNHVGVTPGLRVCAGHRARLYRIARGGSSRVQRSQIQKLMTVNLFAFFQAVAGATVRTSGFAGFADIDIHAGVHVPQRATWTGAMHGQIVGSDQHYADFSLNSTFNLADPTNRDRVAMMRTGVRSASAAVTSSDRPITLPTSRIADFGR
mgnify:CR=1 FL=1